MGEGGEFFEVPHLSLCQGCSHLLTTSASLLAKVRKGSSLQSSFPPHPHKKKRNHAIPVHKTAISMSY